MQVSIEWLHDYIDFKETAEELADKYTMAGVPVENVVRADAGLEKVVTGRIEKLVPNPDSDHLLVCQMNVGEKERITIQTGADNVKEGDIVPVALVGAHLPNGLKISKGKLRGIVSNGMLCSASELKLDESQLMEEQKQGIYILPPDTPVGLSASEVLGLDGVVLEFELTANRAKLPSSREAKRSSQRSTCRRTQPRKPPTLSRSISQRPSFAADSPRVY